MTIGIDVDDTITDTYESFIQLVGMEYHVNINELYKKKMRYEDFENNPSYPNFNEFIKQSYDAFAPIVNIKKDAVEVINKLHDEGHKIIIITARDNDYYTNAYQTTYDYLKNNYVKFDKLIVNSHKKGKDAKKEGVELFIDDALKHCLNASNHQIDTIQFASSFNQTDPKIKVMDNWHEIYEYINSKK